MCLSKACTTSWDDPNPSELVDDFATGPGSHGAVQFQQDPVRHEVYRPISIRKVQPPGVGAAEGVCVRPPSWILVHKIGGDRTCAVSIVGIRPRTPAVQFRQILAYHERIAEAVTDVRCIQPVMNVTAPHQAVTVRMPVEGAIGAFVGPIRADVVQVLAFVGPPIRAADALVVGLPDRPTFQVTRVGPRSKVAIRVAGT